MGSFKHIGLVCALFLVIGTATAGAADVAKIGVIDFQKVLKLSSGGKAAQEEIKKEHGMRMADLKKKDEEIQSLKNRLEREALVMNREQREEKEREIRIKINDFKTLEKKYAKELRDKEKELITKIQKDVADVVREIGKQEAYLIILERLNAGVVYAPDYIDITDKVITIYNARFAEEKGAAKD